MAIDEHFTTDLLALSMQLNRQAFAQPQIDGWLSSFLAVLTERFPAIGGVHVVQAIGNTGIVQAASGSVPENSGDTVALDAFSPVAQAMQTRQPYFAQDLRAYPILYGDEPIGALIVYTSALPPVLDDILGALAVQLGAAINQQTHTTHSPTGPLRRQITMMRSLYEVTRNVSTTLETHEVLGRATQSIVETLSVASAAIILYNANFTTGEVVAEYPARGALGTKLDLLASPIVEHLKRDPKPIVIDNIDDALNMMGASQGVAQRLGVKSMIIAPMLVRNALLGSVNISAFGEFRKFNSEEVEGVQAIAVQLAVSIRNAQLFEELESRAAQLERIASLSRSVMSTLDRDAILRQIADQTPQLINTDGISVALHWPDEPMLYLYLLSNPTLSPTEFQFDETALRFVCNSAEALIVDDISGSDYPDYKMLARHAPPDSWDNEPIMHAALIAPLLVGGRAVGTLNLTRKEMGAYSAIDLAVLEQIANQLAIALENARLYAQAAGRVQTERLTNRLTASLQQGDLQTMILNTTQEIAEALGAKKARVRLQAPANDPITADRLRKMFESKSFGRSMTSPKMTSKDKE